MRRLNYGKEMKMARKGKRTLNIVTLVSAILLGGMLTLLLISSEINPRECHLSFCNTFHISVWGRSIAFFNNSDYGPYRGSIIGFVDDQGNIQPPLERDIWFGETMGIYYRYFHWKSGDVLWTLMISIWYPAILFAMLPILWCIRYSVHRKINKKLQMDTTFK